MRGEEKEEGENPKASADPAGNQGREGESKQREGKGWPSEAGRVLSGLWLSLLGPLHADAVHLLQLPDGFVEL